MGGRGPVNAPVLASTAGWESGEREIVLRCWSLVPTGRGPSSFTVRTRNRHLTRQYKHPIRLPTTRRFHLLVVLFDEFGVNSEKFCFTFHEPSSNIRKAMGLLLVFPV